MNKQEQFYGKWKSVIWFVGITGAVYLGFQYLLPLVLPFILSFFLAKLIAPVITWLYKRLHIPKKIGATVILILIAAVSFAIVCYLGITMFREVKRIMINFPIYQHQFFNRIGDLCGNCDSFFKLEDGVTWDFIHNSFEKLTAKITENIMPAMTEHTVSVVIKTAAFVAIVFIIFISTLLFLNDMDELKGKFRTSKAYPYLHPVLKQLGGAGMAYLKAQLIIIGSIAALCTVGLWMIGNPYALLLGILIAVLDAFPVLGSGMVLVPWAIYHMINGSSFPAAVLITLYVLCLTVREVLEPKLIGNKVGIKPIFILMAIFVGIQLFGISGMVLGPIGLVTIKVMLENIN